LAARIVHADVTPADVIIRSPPLRAEFRDLPCFRLFVEEERR
jgi:hypothetical protein